MKGRRRCRQRRRRFLFWTCDGATRGESAISDVRGSEMMLTESINQCHVCQATIAVREPRQTNVAGVQGQWTPSGPPQASGTRLAADLHNRRAFAIHNNHRHPHATWPNATTSGRVSVAGNLPERRRGMLAVWGPRARPGPGRHASWAKVRRNDAQQRIAPRCRPAICGVPGPGRRNIKGGQAHVLEVPGSAHSQAPPISRTGGAAQQDRDSRTAM
jgi:hypothetical protein